MYSYVSLFYVPSYFYLSLPHAQCTLHLKSNCVNLECVQIQINLYPFFCVCHLTTLTTHQ